MNKIYFIQEKLKFRRGWKKAKARGAKIGRPKIPPFTIEKVIEFKKALSYKEIVKNLQECLL